MPSTFTQIYIHVVFAVKHRECVIHPRWGQDLYKYITGIVQSNGHKLLAINGMPDHIHIFINMRPDQSVSELVQKVKANSSRWINQNTWVMGRFSWQSGFGAFSYSISQIDHVIRYVKNQKRHHLKKCFKDEYLKILRQYDVEYNENYLFNFFNMIVVEV